MRLRKKQRRLQLPGLNPSLLVITGQPQAIASKIGNPKPSYRDGIAKTVAKL